MSYQEKWLIQETTMENGYRFTVWSTEGNRGYIYKVYPEFGSEVHYSKNLYPLVGDAVKAARTKIMALVKKAA